VNLSRNFTLEEMPCHERATAADVARLQETVNRVLQPIRDAFGTTFVTSWKWWADGCVPRTGAHAGGGTVDLVVPGAHLPDVFQWGLDNLDRSYVGRWIYEPDVPHVQGEHIHVAPIADMVAEFGPAESDSAAYVEGPPNVYTPVPGWGGASGTLTDPIQVEGLTVSVSRPVPSWVLVLLGGLALGWALRKAERGGRLGSGLLGW